MRNQLLVLLSAVSLVSCARQSEPFNVDLFKLRGAELADHDAAMVRGDQNFVLYGRVSDKERDLSEGIYYVVRRRDVDREATVRFSYQRAGTGSKMMVKTVKLPEGVKRHEFTFVGEDFKKDGKVLAWKAELIEDGKVVSSKQSYMWE